MAHLAQLREVARPLGIGFLGLGMTPNWRREDMPVMPKGRYKIMTAYMPKVGTFGLDMMYRTCTVQANLDFSDEADMVKKLRVSLALQPLATALFANSPFTEGKPNGFLSMRSQIWTDTDNQRAGMLPWAFEDGMGFERWVDYALDVPMYFIRGGDTYIDVSGKSFRDFFAGKLAELPASGRPFPTGPTTSRRFSRRCGSNVILKCAAPTVGPGADCRRSPLTGSVCFTTATRSMPVDMVKGWSTQQRQQLRDDVPKLGFQAQIGNRNVLTLAQETLRFATRSLRRRKRLDRNGRDETRYLRPLEESIARGLTQAQELLEKYNSVWGGTVEPLYDEYAYSAS